MLRNFDLDLDMSKIGKDLKVQLALPNKKIIKNIKNITNASIDEVELNGLPIFTFEIPHKVEIVDFDTDNIEIIDNDDINNIKEEMLIKVTWYNGTKVNWFRVSDITKEENEENTFMVVESKSLPSELRATNVSINKESIDIIEYFETVLYQSPWKLGTVSDNLKNTYRSFDDDKKTRYEAVMSGVETFGAILDWDEENRVLNLKSIDDIREFRGVVLKRENYASSVSVQSSSEEIVTRLYGYGNEGLGIENSNPSGMPYIEDFSYFMSPFKRDSAKNVLSSSSYMSDELCHALLDLEDLKTEYNPKIQNLQNMINSAYTDLSRDMLALQEKQGQLITLQALLDTAKSTNDKDLIYQREMEIRDKELEISTLEENIENIKISIEEWDRQIFNFQQLISTSSFTSELIDELSLFVYEKEFNDDRYIDSQELYEASLEQMEKYQSPVKSFSIDLDSFINSLESQVFNGRLQIGEEVIIKSNKLNMEYRSIILGYNVDFESGHFELNISDNLDDISALDKLASIIYKAESSSTILNNNKYKWDGITSVVDEVSQWRDKEISTVENRITAGANESIVIDNRGIQAHNPDFPDERLIMQSGVIALSKDGGKTWNTSITPDGVIAETVIGKLFAGNNLIITNESGSFVIDSTGLNVNMDSIKIMSGSESNPKDMIDLWNNLLLTYEEILDDGLITQHEKNQLQKQWNTIVDINSSTLLVFEKAWRDLEDSEPEDSPKPKPKPKEYNDYILAYSELDNYLNVTIQSDGYAILDKDNREETTQVDSIVFAQKFKNYNEKKTIFESIIPLEFSNGKIEVLENGISLTYTKNSEIVTMLNLSEEGVRIDGKLLEINSRTEFNADLVMNAGVIKDKDNGIIIDLNVGEITLNKPIKITANSNLVTKDDLEVLELEAYTVVLSNDNSFITTDKDGNNGDFSHAVSTVTVYKGVTDDTSNWNITAVKSNGVVGALSGRTYTVTNMVGDSGKVIFTATNKSNSELSLSKDFDIIKTKAGLDGEDGKIKNINLVSDGYVISYKGEQPLPAKQTIKMQAFTDGLEGIVVWEIVPYKNNIAQSPITKSVVNNTIEINELDFANSVDMIKVKITCDGLIDTATIVKIRNGLDGNSGKDGIAGKDGVGVKTTKIEYSKSESGVTPPTTGWNTTIPLVPSGQFLWTKTTWVYTDNSSEIGYTVSKIGADGNTGQDGIAGKDGVGVKTTTIEYVGSTSGTTTPSTGWSTTIPPVTAGNYLWTKTTWTYTDNTNEVGYSVARMGVNGKDGTDGIAGKDGVGLKNTVIEYAQSTSGTTKPTSGWSIDIPTVPSGNYLWTKTTWTYTDGTSETGYTVSRIGKDGMKGDDGIAGKDGVGLQSTKIEYVGSNNGVTKPTTGWMTTIPSVPKGQFLWTRTTWTYTDNTTETGYSVAKMGEDGQDGQDGQDGEDSITGLLTNESITLSANSSGQVLNYVGASGEMVVYDGVNRVLTGVIYSVVSPKDITVTIGVDGKFSVSAMTSGTTVRSGTATIRAVYKNITIDKILSVTKALQGVQGVQGNNGKDGVAGKDGVGISDTVIMYAQSTNGTTAPSAGWTPTIPTVPSGSYLWTQTTWKYTDGTNEVGYTVSRIGKDGNTGKDGIAGKDGVGLQSTKVEYAHSTSGTTAPTTGWTLTVPTVPSGSFLWTRTIWTYTDSTTETGYSVSRIGNDGNDGIAGKDGVGVKTTTITYSQSTSGTTAPTSSWSTSVPTLVKGQYLWTKTTWTYTDNSTEIGYTVSYNAKDGNTGKDGIAGKDGVGISNTLIQYVGSTSGTTKPTSGWSTTIPTVAEGSFLWTKTTWTYTDNSTEVGYSVAKMGTKGATGATGATGAQGPRGLTGAQGPQGNQGIQGPKGLDGKPSYTHIAYADTITGSGFSHNDATKPFIGIYADSNPTSSETASKYTWSKWHGEDGNDGVQGPKGDNGQPSYTHFAYANNATGTSGFSTTDSLNKSYLGIYTDNTKADSSDPSKYTWTLIKGATGAQGPQGVQGLQGPQGNQGIKGDIGATGKSSYTHIAYATGNQGQSFNHSTFEQATHVGMYVSDNQNSSGNWRDYQWTLIRGRDGSQGIQGIKGTDGKTPYFHIAYANNATGTSGFSINDSTNKLYIGTYTDFTEADSTDPSKYAWTLIKGSTGSSATSYWLTTSNNIIAKSQTGTLSPTTITFTGYSKTGTANSALYAGRFIIQTSTNGTSYTKRYESSANQTAYTYTIPADTKFIKALFYQAGGTSVLLDEQTVPIVESAEGIQVGGENLIRASGWGSYSPYNTVPVYSKGDISFIRNGETYIAIRNENTVLPYGTEVFYTLSGIAKIDGVPATSATWGAKTASTYQGKVMRFYINDVTGYFEIVQNWTSSSNWILHTQSLIAPKGTTITIEKFKMEKGTVATDWRPHPEDARTYKAWANSADGTTDFTKVYPNENLLLESNQSVTNSNYNIRSYSLADNTLTATDDVVITIKGALGADRNSFRAYNSGGTYAICTFTSLGNGIYQYKGKWNPNGGNSSLVIYQFNSTNTSSSTIEWIKLEKGTTPTIYTTNPQDSLSGSIPKYVGFSPLDSNKPSDYEWIINPEWSESSSKEYTSSSIEQTSKSIMTTVTESFVAESEFSKYRKDISTEFVQTAKDFNLLFRNVSDEIIGLEGTTENKFEQIEKYIRFIDGKIVLGASDSDSSLEISNDQITFKQSGNDVAYFTGQAFYINKGILVESMQVGQHRMTKGVNGHTTFNYVG